MFGCLAFFLFVLVILVIGWSADFHVGIVFPPCSRCRTLSLFHLQFRLSLPTGTTRPFFQSSFVAYLPARTGYWAIETWEGEPYLAKVSWKYILQALQWARKYGLRVNLDLHSVGRRLLRREGGKENCGA
jgi:hypothetical protein